MRHHYANLKHLNAMRLRYSPKKVQKRLQGPLDASGSMKPCRTEINPDHHRLFTESGVAQTRCRLATGCGELQAVFFVMLHLTVCSVSVFSNRLCHSV